MGAFMIFHSTVKDAEAFQVYAQSVAPTLAPFGGEVVMRGKVAGVRAGEHAHQAVGVLRFPDRRAANAWYDSEAYQALIANRDRGAAMTAIVYDEP